MIEPAASDSREVRVFLSSTFRDFSEERELLAKQVFPALNRRARERGVELVEVDLRWGVTQEQVEDGHALEICLKEIERCKPYFIGLLGDSYGSLPQPSQIKPELLEQRPELRGRIGGASYTELEIEHSLQVLRDPLLMGQAFFYFRDPAYSDGKAAAGEAGWRSETPETRQKLELLKRKIHSSGYPLKEGIENPPAIAALIEADLWALIDQRFPEGEAPDALEKEERKHADYRRARIGKGQYIGGEGYLQQLESWIEAGQQQILITGKSGAGKSALLANWVQRHGQDQPQDVIYCHHLGCTNDASALRPLLARLIQSASRLLEAEGVIQEELAIPNDWWELVAKVAETLQVLGRWAVQNHRRWIWVLDGLDRLAPDDQKVLPWLPQTLPAGIQVVASALPSSALPSSAMGILQERQYTTLTIGPLQRPEQERLIESYLKRFSRQLESRFVEQVLSHPLAGSPLFLRVLLEELRQCGRFDTLNEQLGIYCSAQTVDDLYGRVLERLENDGHGDAVRKVLTALWASRAGLTETELLKIRQLAPLQWAPIDLALEKAFGRNGNRLVFDHDYLRKAVQDRYLPSEEDRRQAHSELADWFAQQQEWDERKAEEWPWQLQGAGRLSDLRGLLLNVSDLVELAKERDNREVINYWLIARAKEDGELDELIAEAVEDEIENRRDDADDLIWFVDRLAGLLSEAGLYRELLLRLRALSLELEEASDDRNEESLLSSLQWLADAHRYLANYQEAEQLYKRCLEARERLLGPEHPSTLSTVNNLGLLYSDKGDYEQAEALYLRALEASERLLGPEHPSTLTTVDNLGLLYYKKGDYEQAEALYLRDLEASERLLGPEHPSTLSTVNNLGLLYSDKGDYEQAEALYLRALEASERLLGPEHPSTLTTVDNLAGLYQYKGDYEQAEALFLRALEAKERLLGPEHPDTLSTVGNLAGLYQDKGDYEQAEALYLRDLEASERLLGPEHPSTLITVNNLGLLYSNKGDYEQAEALFLRALEARERLLGPEHPSTLITVGNLGLLYSNKGDYEQAEALYLRALEASERLLGPEHPETLTTVANLAGLYSNKGDYEQAEALYLRALEASERLLGPEHPSTLITVNNLGLLYSNKGDYEQAEALYLRDLEASERLLGPENPSTLTTVGNLAGLYRAKGDYEQAEAMYLRALEARERLLGPEHPDTLTTVNNLAGLYYIKGDYEQAEALYLRALEAKERLLGPEHPSTLTTVGNLAGLYSDKGDYEQAEALYLRALEARERLLGPEHPYTNNTRYFLANLLSDQERYGESITLRRQELAVAAQRDGRDASGTLTSIHDLADDLYWNDDLQEAEQLYREALAGRIAVLGDDDSGTMASRYGLARCLSAQKRQAEAIPLRRSELSWCREQNGDTDPDTLTSINYLAIDLRETGELAEAEALFRELLASRVAVLPPDDFEISRTLGGLAKTLEKQERWQEARELAQQALDHLLQHEGTDSWHTNFQRLDLARVLHQLADHAEALQLLAELQTSISAKPDQDDDDSDLLAQAAELKATIEANAS